jgi:hypothetical protein
MDASGKGKEDTGECGSICRSPSLDMNKQKSREDHIIPFREVNSKRPIAIGAQKWFDHGGDHNIEPPRFVKDFSSAL